METPHESIMQSHNRSRAGLPPFEERCPIPKLPGLLKGKKGLVTGIRKYYRSGLGPGGRCHLVLGQ